MTLFTFAIEPYSQIHDEVSNLLIDHYREIAADQDIIPLDPDENAYRQMEAEGALHIVALRGDGKLVGYCVGIVRPHLHYKSTLHCFTDIYYIMPEHRRGGLGIKLFVEFERTLRARGVKKIFIGSKVYLDMSPLFERLNWRKIENVYSKILDGDGSTDGMTASAKTPC